MTRRRLSPQERREQLVSAAVELISEAGFRAATAEALAARAGVSKGLLWHYFTDLDALLEIAARQTLVDLRAAVAATIDLSAPADIVIRGAISGAVELRRTHGAQRRALYEIVLNLRNDDGSLRFSAADLDETYARQAAIFRRGQHEGTFRASIDPYLMAVTYQGAVDGMLTYLDAHPDTDATAFADTLADILLRGLCETF